MKLLAVYVALVLVGILITYLIGRGIEQMWPAASLLSFLAMFFMTLFIAWRIAIRIA